MYKNVLLVVSFIIAMSSMGYIHIQNRKINDLSVQLYKMDAELEDEKFQETYWYETLKYCCPNPPKHKHI